MSEEDQVKKLLEQINDLKIDFELVKETYQQQQQFNEILILNLKRQLVKLNKSKNESVNEDKM